MDNVIPFKRPAIEKNPEQDYAFLKTTKNKKTGRPQYEVRIQFLGKRERFYFDTKPQAEEFLKNKRKEIKERQPNYRKGDVEYYTLGNVFREMNHAKLDSGKIRKSTFINNESIFNIWLAPYQNFYTHQINEKVWDALAQKVKEKKVPSRLEKILILLNNINKYILKKNIDPFELDLDECEAGYTNKVRAKSSYTMDEYEKLISLLDQKDKLKQSTWVGVNTLIFGMNTGLRIGEILSLDFKKDIDLENKKISVTTSWNHMTKEIGDVKTKASVRTIGFNEDALVAIYNLMEVSKNLGSTLLVYCPKRRRSKNQREDRPIDLTKEPVGHGVLYGYLKNAMKAAGLQVINSQSAMRKTHITNLIIEAELNGTSSFIEAATVAQHRAGHRKLTTTLDEYTKTSTQKEEKLIGSMSRVNRAKQKPNIDFDNMTREQLIEHLKKIS